MALGGKIMGFYELIEKYGKGAGDAKMKELTKVLDDFFDELKEANREKIPLFDEKGNGSSD